MKGILWFPALLAAVTPIFAASAVATNPPSAPLVGSVDTVGDPPLQRPTTTPIIVPLINNAVFAGARTQSFLYMPPKAPSNNWAKVILVADGTVTNIQVTKTIQLLVNHTSLYFGATPQSINANQEEATISTTNHPPDHWHIEQDVTDDSAIFQTSQSGELILSDFHGLGDRSDYLISNNLINGVIQVSAHLEFYPTDGKNRSASVPDSVIPLPNQSGGAVQLNQKSQNISSTLSLPRNIERAYLDVVAQGNGNDELWFTGVGSNQISVNYGGMLPVPSDNPYQEIEVTIDGQPAGLAPITPLIPPHILPMNSRDMTNQPNGYAGMWYIVPATQALNLIPYRLDLTPFAGLLSNGAQHTITLSVGNTDSGFLVSGNLYLFLDKNSKQITGALTTNTLKLPTQVNVVNQVQVKPVWQGTRAVGALTFTATANYTLAGYVNTSHGTVVTTEKSGISALNQQQLNFYSSDYSQGDENIILKLSSYQNVITQNNTGAYEKDDSYYMPIKFWTSGQTCPDSECDEQKTGAETTYLMHEILKKNGTPIFWNQLLKDSKHYLLSSDGKRPAVYSQIYSATDSSGNQQNRTVTSDGAKVTNVINSQ